VSRALRVATTLLMIGSFAACGGSGRVDDAAEEASVAPRFLSMGTAPPGGAFFVVGSALTEVLNEAGADQRFNVTAEATSGSQENIRRLASGEIDFALSNAAISYFAIRGTEGWDRAYPIRSIMTLAPNVALFLTANGSGIETLADLRDKRVSVGPAGAGFEYFVGPLLAAHGVTYDDFTPLNATQQAAVDMLADGASDAAFLGGAVPTASITQAAASMDVVFLPYGETEKQQLVEEFPFFRPATIPADTYRTQTETFEGLDTGSMHLITSADVPDDLIYAVTKMLYENRESVVEKHPAGRYINPNNVVRDTGTEFHPGAIRFFQEIGIWSE
jgi:TRAP transporter TAXI family solute receptor